MSSEVPDFEREANAYSYDDTGSGVRVVKVRSAAKLGRDMFAAGIRHTVAAGLAPPSVEAEALARSIECSSPLDETMEVVNALTNRLRETLDERAARAMIGDQGEPWEAGP